MQEDITIFNLMYDKYKIDKPIRLIELFGGYGSQALALKYLGVEFEHWKLCEWAIKSIQAYKDIHFENDNNDYSESFDIDYIKDFLYKKGISKNYNEPMTKEEINKMSENYAKKIFNNIIATNNLVNISTTKAKDLEIKNTDKYCYIMTYSFPCQDLSLAGRGKGMKDTSTRSGLLWEVERILNELEEKPQILLMENVPQVHSQDNIKDFHKWQLRLENLGYKNYCQDLIATDYGIPQTRNRCFMVSILGDYYYTFPKPIPLKLKLKDLLEDNVDKKYYLENYQIEKIMKSNYCQSQRRIQSEEVCDTLCARDWKDPKCIQIKNATKLGNRQPLVRIGNKSLQETLEKNEIDSTCYIDTYNKRIDKEKCGTITTGVSFRNNTFLAIKNATQKGYLEATDGDGIDLAQPNSETRRGRVQKDSIQTLTTHNNLGVVSDLRIRKLTPRECFRLMGVKQEDYLKCAKNQSDSSLYHLAGDSIVVNVLMAIFKQLL